MEVPSSRRAAAVVAALLIIALAPWARAQDEPRDPYGPAEAKPAPKPAVPAPKPAAPAATPGAADDIDAEVAAALFDRGVELYGGGEYADAKTMFVESLERSPSGAKADESLRMLRQCNQQLGNSNLEDGRPAPAGDGGGPIDPYASGEGPIDPYAGAGGAGHDGGAGLGGPLPAGPVDETRAGNRHALLAFGAGAGLLAGFALAGPEDDSGAIGGGAVLAGLLGGGAGLALTYYADRRWRPDAGQVAATVAGGTWGTFELGLLGDMATGFDTSANDEYKFLAAGSLLGLGGGVLYARATHPSVGDVAFTNSLGMYGTGIALLLGVALDPPHGEAYSLNALLGSAAGLGAGLWLADKVTTSRSRMILVDLGAAAGAAAPWVLLYPFMADDATASDEQATGLISSLTLGVGAAVAWYWTRDHDGTADTGPAPTAALDHGRHGWRLGAALPRPIVSLAGTGAGVGIDLLSGRF